MSHEFAPSRIIDEDGDTQVTPQRLNQPDTNLDEAFQNIVLGDIVDRLYTNKVPEKLELNKDAVLEILIWADSELKALEEYKSTLGIDIPVSLEEYFTASTSPTEWKIAYDQELENRLSSALAEIEEHFTPEYASLELQVRADAQKEGCDAAQTEWRVGQALDWKRGQIEEFITRPRRDLIRNEMERDYPAPKRLPSLESRLYQLADMYVQTMQLESAGKKMKLVPVPYKTIDEKILPAFSAHDTAPRQWPNHGRDLGEFYIDPTYIGILRGDGMFKRSTVHNTYYEDIHKRDETIGDFGLALIAVGDTHSGLDDSMSLAEVRTYDYQEAKVPRLSKADFAVGIVWALETVARVRRGEVQLNQFNPVKMILPGFIRSATDKNAAVVSVYLTNPDNPYDRRLGIAFDAYSETQAQYDTYPTVQVATSW